MVRVSWYCCSSFLRWSQTSPHHILQSSREIPVRELSPGLRRPVPPRGFRSTPLRLSAFRAAWRFLRRTDGSWRWPRWRGSHPSNHRPSALLALGLCPHGFPRMRKAHEDLEQRHLTQGVDSPVMDKLRGKAQRPPWCRRPAGKGLHPGMQGSPDGHWNRAGHRSDTALAGDAAGGGGGENAPASLPRPCRPGPSCAFTGHTQ